VIGFTVVGEAVSGVRVTGDTIRGESVTGAIVEGASDLGSRTGLRVGDVDDGLSVNGDKDCGDWLDGETVDGLTDGLLVSGDDVGNVVGDAGMGPWVAGEPVIGLDVDGEAVNGIRVVGDRLRGESVGEAVGTFVEGHAVGKIVEGLVVLPSSGPCTGLSDDGHNDDGLHVDGDAEACVGAEEVTGVNVEVGDSLDSGSDARRIVPFSPINIPYDDPYVIAISSALNVAKVPIPSSIDVCGPAVPPIIVIA